jgi:hypothetical protein
MMPEYSKSSLIDNVSLGTFPLQEIGLWKPKIYYEINTRFYGDAISYRPTQYEQHFLVNGQTTTALHGCRRLL